MFVFLFYLIFLLIFPLRFYNFFGFIFLLYMLQAHLYTAVEPNTEIEKKRKWTVSSNETQKGKV